MVQDCSLEDDHRSPLHCCIVLFCPTVGRLLPLCPLPSEDWGSNPSLDVNPNVGQICEKYEKSSDGGVFPDFSLGQAERPAVRRRFCPDPEGRTGRKPGIHFEIERKAYEKTKQDHHHPCYRG